MRANPPKDRLNGSAGPLSKTAKSSSANLYESGGKAWSAERRTVVRRWKTRRPPLADPVPCLAPKMVRGVRFGWKRDDMVIRPEGRRATPTFQPPGRMPSSRRRVVRARRVPDTTFRDDTATYVKTGRRRTPPLSCSWRQTRRPDEGSSVHPHDAERVGMTTFSTTGSV